MGIIMDCLQHSAAAHIYLEVGAVEFLSQLRPSLDSGLQKIVDAILDNLFHLPTANAEVHSAECIYHPRTVGGLTGMHFCMSLNVQITEFDILVSHCQYWISGHQLLCILVFFFNNIHDL